MDHSGEESPMNSQTRTHSHLREEKKKGKKHSDRKTQRAKSLKDNSKLSKLIFSLVGERHVLTRLLRQLQFTITISSPFPFSSVIKYFNFPRENIAVLS